MSTLTMNLEAVKKIDVRLVDPDTLVDICTTKVNTELPLTERMIDFIEQIKNPYCYKCKNVVIQIGFADTDITIEERIESYFRML